jgi:hypothetical protein
MNRRLFNNSSKYRFSEYRSWRKTKIPSKGYYQLVSQIRDKTINRSILSLSPGRDYIYEVWDVSKNKKGEIFFGKNLSEHRMLKSRILNILNKNKFIGIVLTVLTENFIKINTDQDIQIKELWGFKMMYDQHNSKTFLETFNSEELYDVCTKNYHGKTVLPRKELVYCGNDGKICGWDML